MCHSIREAGLVAADHAVRTDGIPALPLWVRVFFNADNETAIKVLGTGENPTMDQMGRTHKVDFM